jgi:hypothetical protein
MPEHATAELPAWYCRSHFGWLWGFIAFAWRGGGNAPKTAKRVSHVALTTQRFLTKCVWGVTFKGSKLDERHDWRWTPTTNQDVNASTVLILCNDAAGHGCCRHALT